MSNLTISIDDALIKQARIRVAQQGTSLSAKVRDTRKTLRDELYEGDFRAKDRSGLSLDKP